MKFPRGKPILFALKGDFVNFDGILTVPKRMRAYQRAMMMTIDYPDASDVIFFKKGEVYRIMRKSTEGFKEITLEAVKDKIEKTDSSIVNMFFTEEALLDLIVTGFKKEKAEIIDGSVTDVEEYLKNIQKEKFSGFIVIEAKDEYSYLVMVEGRFLHIFLANNKTDSDSLWIYLLDKKTDTKLWIFKEVPSETQYATSAQMELVFHSIEKLLTQFAGILGPNIVSKLTEIAKRNISKEFPFFEKVRFREDFKIEGDIRVELDILVKGFATFLGQLVDSLAPLSAGRHMEILKNSLRDYRFALSGLGFFDFFKYKINW